MEKHNTHILLESFSSERHDYEVDENGNIKLEENEDAPYHSFIQKKGKMSIKEILIENNNIFKKELEKIVLSEEKPTKSKKKRKKIDSDVYVKAEEYRFNEKKIKPCFNEVGIEYKKNKNKFIDLSDQEMDNKNLSQEIIGKNRNFNDDKIKFNLKRKRYTMNNLEYENKNKKIYPKTSQSKREGNRYNHILNQDKENQKLNNAGGLTKIERKNSLINNTKIKNNTDVKQKLIKNIHSLKENIELNRGSSKNIRGMNGLKVIKNEQKENNKMLSISSP